MARYAFAMPLRPEAIEEYARLHAAPPAELLSAISRTGVRNYSIYLCGDLAIGYLEADDPVASLAAGAALPIAIDWQERVRWLRADDGPLVELREVFHVD
jgi:L-rhamnose mutarotase